MSTIIVFRWPTALLECAVAVSLFSGCLHAAPPIPKYPTIHVIKIPAESPKWELEFTKHTISVPVTPTNGNARAAESRTHTRLRIERIIQRPAKIQLGPNMSLPATVHFELIDIEKQRKLQGLRQILGMAKQAKDRGDYANKTKVIPNTKSEAYYLLTARSNTQDMEFVCHDKQFFGNVSGHEYTIEEIADLVDILTNWSKYEAQARKSENKVQVLPAPR